MDALITPSTLCGELASISSKSYVHRLLICAAFSDSPTEIVCGSTLSKDIEATIGCLRAVGCGIEFKDDHLFVEPVKAPAQLPFLNCYESGSTLRFLLPVVATLGVDATFLGTGKLPQRPLEPLIGQLKKHGVIFFSESLPTTLTGKLTGGVFELMGNVSSQFVTGLLLALPLVKGGGEIRLLSPLESKSYVDITIEVMRDFGINVECFDGGYRVPDTLGYTSPKKVHAQGDWSNAAFWLCCGAISNKITCMGLDLDSAQGDRDIVEILRQYGARVEADGNRISVSPKGRHPICVDASDIPDLVPIISVLAAASDGVSRICNVQRLQLKESDRINSVIQMINSLGGKAEYINDEIVITGNGKLVGGCVNGFNDHRIVMSASIASTQCDGEVRITDAGAVSKSYPQFFEDFKKLGGIVNVF